MALASFAPRSCASLPCRAASPSTSVFAAWNRRARNCQAHSVFFLRCVKLQICPWRVDDRHTRIPQFLFARPCRTPRSDSLDPVRRRAFAARRGCLPSTSAFWRYDAQQSGLPDGDVEKVKALISTLPGDNHLVVVEGVDHFFASKLDQLGRAINAWLTGEVLRLRH